MRVETGAKAKPAPGQQGLCLIDCAVAQCAAAMGEETVRILDEQPYVWERVASMVRRLLRRPHHSMGAHGASGGT